MRKISACPGAEAISPMNIPGPLEPTWSPLDEQIGANAVRPLMGFAFRSTHPCMSANHYTAIVPQGMTRPRRPPRSGRRPVGS